MANSAKQKLHIGKSSNAEGSDDDFYEKIEAPKFIDFIKPEIRRLDEDRYWFCKRVGCDLKHEEEMDYEAIEKDFVLRVMAARSPNVGFQKALRSRSDVKCPRTVPPKSSRSRISRLAAISSVPTKLDDDKVKPVLKSSKTPSAEAKQFSKVPKALTTPRNKKRLSTGGQFRSVRHPETRTVTVPKNKVVSKALAFDSPKKTEKTRNEMESNNAMSSICSGMKKLKITSSKKHLGRCNSKPLATARKELKGREVKSRVFDSLYSKNNISKETKAPSSEMKRKETTKHARDPLSSDGAECDSSDMEIDDKSRNGSLGKCPVLETYGSNEQGKYNLYVGMKSQLVAQDAEPREIDITEPQAPRDDYEKIDKENSCVEKTRLCLQEGELQKTVRLTGKDNDPALDDKENNGGLLESNNYEAAPDDNRKENPENKHPNKKVLGKLENSKTPKKLSHTSNKKSGKSSATTGGVQGVKFSKPKPTNPKPFRFRTDERGILKEANLERKLNQVESLKKQEITGVVCSGTLKEPQQDCSRKIQRQVSTQKKSIKDNRAPDSNSFLEKAGSPAKKPKNVKSRKVVSNKKGVSILIASRLSVIPESRTLEPQHTEKPPKIGASPTKSAVLRSLRKQRRLATTPKEPVFCELHIPKSCTSEVA